jgi:hypothetical protein
MTDFHRILIDALQQETTHLQVPALANATPETNVFDYIDSMTIVNLILKTETMLEVATGNYVTLADENIFDARKSYLLKWSRWVEFVDARHGR